jgi:cytochrome c553
MKMLLLIMLPIAIALLPVYPSWGGDAAAGKTKSANCYPCHGKDGISRSPDTPNLAGQKKKYLVNALKAYRSGAREVHTMTPAVNTLTDKDIADIAEYFAGLKPPCDTPAPPPLVQ